MCHIIKSSRNTHSRQHVTKGLQNIKPEYIPVGCLPSTAVAAEVGCIPACTGQGRVSAQGGCVAGGVCPGVSAQGGVCWSACWDTHTPYGQNSWHTLVKTLPFRNYVADRNKLPLLGLHLWIFFMEVKHSTIVLFCYELVYLYTESLDHYKKLELSNNASMKQCRLFDS